MAYIESGRDFHASDIEKRDILDLYRDDIRKAAKRYSSKVLALFENAVAQMIRATGRELYLYARYNKEKHRNDIEIDFLLSNESKTGFKVYPVEAKSSKNYSTASLDRFRDLFPKRIAASCIVHPKGYTLEKNLVRIPPYMLFCALENLSERV